MNHRRFDNFKARTRTSAGQLNTHVARLRQLTPLSGVFPILAASTPMSGTAIALSSFLRSPVIDMRLGVITDAGPQEEDEDYADERYWVKWVSIVEGLSRERIGNVANEGCLIISPPEDDDGKKVEPSPVTVTNLCEHAYGGHGLPVDETKFVWCWQHKDAGGIPVWLMNEPVQPWIKIISDAGGNGKYNAKLLFSPAPDTVLDDADNLTEAMCGDLGTETVFAFNVREVGESTHDLDSGALPLLFAARYIGSTADETPIPCFIFDGLQWEDCP